ncbi:hypothetical protein EX30DRAFT_340740, partial [Ascodesmis nigricans]
MATIPQNAIDLVLPQTKAPVSNDISHNTVSQAVSDHAALNTGSNIVSDTQSNISSNINNRNIAAILTAGPPMKTVLPEVDPVASHNTTSQAITQSAASHPVGSNINKSPKNTAPNRGTTAFSTAVSGPPMKLLLPQTEGDNGVSHNNVSQSVSQTLPQTIAQSASRPAELNNMSTIKSAPNPQTSTATAGTSNKLVQTQAQAHDTHAVYYPASNTASNTGLKAVSQLAAQSTYHLVSHNEPNIDSKSNTAANIHTTTATGAAANLPKKLVLPQTQAHNAQIVTLPASEPSYHPFSHTGPHKRSNSKIATNPRTITAANPPMKLVPQAQIHPAQTVSHDLSLTGPNTGLNTRPNINTNNISTNPGTSTHANVVTRNTVAHSRSDTGSKTGSNNKTRKIATNPLACAATPPMKLVPQAQARDAQDVSHTTSPPGSHTVSQPRSHAVLNTNHSDMATTLQTPMKSVLPQAQANNAQTASYHASNTGSNTGLNIVSQPTSQAVSHPGSQPVSQALSHPGHHPSMPNTVVNLNTSITNISTPHQTATTLALPQTQVNANAVSHTGLNAIFHPSPHSIPHLSSHTNLTNHNISGLGASAMTSRRKRSAD